jgi:hypothetical protein
MSDSEKLIDIEKRLKKVQVSVYIHTIVAVIVFLGVVNMNDLIKKLK